MPRLLGPVVRPYRRALLLIVGLQLFQVLALLYLPTLNADIIDRGVVRGDTDRIVQVGGLMIVVTVLQGAATIWAVYLSARVAAAVGRDLRERLFDKVQEFAAREVGSFGVPTLVTRTTNDVQQVQTLLLSALTMIVTAPIMAVGGIVLALQQHAELSALLVFLVPVLGVLLAVVIRRMRGFARAMQLRIDALNRVLREQIMGIRVIRAFVKDDFEQKRFRRVNEELAEVSVRLGRLTTLMLPMVITTVNLFSVAVVWFAAGRVENGDMRIGALTAYLTYLVLIQTAVTTATFVIMQLPRAEVCATRIREVFATEPAIVRAASAVTRMPHEGEVELRGVHFTYPAAEEAVLSDVDLAAHPGGTTAIVGSTGSGKSTLLGLVCRLFDATAGEVRVGGVDVRALDPEVLVRTVAYVPQQAYLFSGTIASNLRYGRPTASDEDLWHALGVAQAREFVEALDGGLDAPVSQGGANLSGGQRQRLAIARAVVRRPRIYLFDDSFSALDYVTDAALRRALKPETADATVVIVAQRIATVRDADRIIVLDEGRVAGVGTHDELMRTSQVYGEIVYSQADKEITA